MMKNRASSSGGSGNGNNRGESEVFEVGRRRSSCGYCKSSVRTSITYGLWANSLTVDDYQDLLDRGWRRSGCYLYRPEMDKTCCPQYTIRLKASDFVPSKEQQRVSKQMQRFLDGNFEVKESQKSLDNPYTSNNLSSLVQSSTIASAGQESLKPNTEEKNQDVELLSFLSDQINCAARACIERGEFPLDILLPKPSVKKVSQGKKKLLAEGSEDLLYSSNISFLIKAALVRRDRRHDMKGSGGSKQENEELINTELTSQAIAEKLVTYLNNLADTSGLSARACNGHINFYATTKQARSDEVVDVAMVRKESRGESVDEGSSMKKVSGGTLGKRKRLEIILKRSCFDPKEYELYRKYQINVHNDAPDHVSESSYMKFLVDSPLVYVPSNGDDTVPQCGFGSFHQQYVIDGRLVAVGVIDILPKCLSSKYLFWDPEYASLSLGKYSALQEISCVRENQAHCRSLQYYYMGYYIHSCNKMRYKAAYRPSELLCPLRYLWFPFEIAKPWLDKKRYVILSDLHNLQAVESSTPKLSSSQLEPPHDNSFQEENNDVPFDEDEEMSEVDSEDSEDESDPETNDLALPEFEDPNVGDVLIGLKGSRLRYQDIHHALAPNQRSHLVTKLRMYKEAVGEKLSKQMVLSLG
ncbi:hypothetical protein DCAR_0830768 [Daucus carota subsp. sativus]|uniref:Arginyl-tRNA--protein transferase n=1 Tax=Daucus carota subsp. sativus TaxID=79200 RepID=A0AAF1BBS3_DAUCS|nr:PREDICTED: arginyl-tRNA--protein transferase 2-like [Daucus carota subsp. sativus]WOH11287.1 hypothetical protein DCAR_0830768 [Daucus carota subsp. sativus]